MLKILLIEDEFIIAKDIKVFLSKDNYALVDIARNGSMAIELFSNNVYDLIISDINLDEDKDGIEVITELSKIKLIPVVYLTAYSDTDIVKRAEKTMPFAYLLKPYNNNQLKVTINLAILNSSKNNYSSNYVELETSSKLDLLTTREKEILICFANGNSSKNISAILNISIHTVNQHKKNIKKKLGISTVGELIHFAVTCNLHKVYYA